MSRGPGKRQRQILETLEEYPDGFYLAALTDNITENKSLNRAAWALANAGKVRLDKYMMGMIHVHSHYEENQWHRNGVKLGGPKIVVRMPDADPDKLNREELERRFWEIRAEIDTEGISEMPRPWPKKEEAS